MMVLIQLINGVLRKRETYEIMKSGFKIITDSYYLLLVTKYYETNNHRKNFRR